MKTDLTKSMSAFLMFRSLYGLDCRFDDNVTPWLLTPPEKRIPVSDSYELEKALRQQVIEATKSGKTALALSGGIDSAILAKFVPKDTVTYTFKCIVPGVEVTDETKAAKRYADECGLEHRVVEIYWEDFEKLSPLLMKRKGAPIHSIEVQIYKAALQAKKDGFDKFIFGESADCLYGGHSGMLSKDWTIGDFVDRYSYVLPYKALRHSTVITEPFLKYENDGFIDLHNFIQNVYVEESINSYYNALGLAEIDGILPYLGTKMSVPLDYQRIRKGENKYLVREVFKRLYPDFEIPIKTPMPRPTTEWLKDWAGPTRKEFLPHCTDNMSGDQKWLVYCLELFLNLLDEQKK